MFHCHLLIHLETPVNKRASMQGLFPGQTASPRLRNVFGIGGIRCCGHHDLDLEKEDSIDKLIGRQSHPSFIPERPASQVWVEVWRCLLRVTAW